MLDAWAASVRRTLGARRARCVAGALVAHARNAAAAAHKAEGSAAARFSVANQQYEIALKSIRLGEISAVDLFRVRQIRLEAQRSHVAAQVEAGLAVSRLNQARGYAPGR